MNRPRYLIVILIIALIFGVVLWALWPSPSSQSVSLLLQTNYVAQSSNLASFYVSNAGPRAILLTDLIVEAQTARGWRAFSHSVPSHPQRLATGDSKDLSAGVPAGMVPWRLRVAYGTDVKEPMLQLVKAEYALTHFRLTGPGFGIMAGSNTLASAEIPALPGTADRVPEIVGSARFSNQVHQALLLLSTRDPDAYKILTDFVGRIQEGERSGMWVYRNPPTYEMSDKTAFYSLTWCAATIAHDSFHSKLYHDSQKEHGDSVPDSAWTGKVAEQQCMKHQLDVMGRIGAPKSELDYALSQADGHYVKEHETWQDYQQHKW